MGLPEIHHQNAGEVLRGSWASGWLVGDVRDGGADVEEEGKGDGKDG